MKVCRDVEEWITENIEKEVEKQENRCQKWPWPLSWLCSLVTFIVKVIVVVVTKVVRVVCEIVNVVLNVVAAVVNFVLALPIIGPIVRAVIRIVTTVVSYLVGLLDGLGRLVGIRITKHLRVRVVVLCEGDVPLAYPQHLAKVMDQTAATLYQRAQIRLHVAYDEPIRNPPRNALRVGTNADLIADEAWLKGSWHQLQTVKSFETNFSSLIGLGAPIVVYIVREVGYDGPGNVVGCSAGPLTDWIAVERDFVVSDLIAPPGSTTPAQPPAPYPPVVASSSSVASVPNPNFQRYVIVHEICHALGLLGHANSNSSELMFASTILGDHLSPFQVGIVRSSSHVTFF